MPSTTAVQTSTTTPAKNISTTAQTSTPVTTPEDDSWMDDTGVWLVTGQHELHCRLRNRHNWKCEFKGQYIG